MDERVSSPDQDGSDEDTTNRSGTSSAPLTPASRAWWTRRRRWWGLAAAGVAVAVIAALVVNAATDNERERLVRDFMEASRNGNVEEALDLADAEDPSEAQAAFLVPEAAHPDWEILNVEETSHHQGNRTPSRSTVEVEVSDPNGTQHSTELRLTDEDDGWSFEDAALPTARFPDSGLWYAELNGVTVPAEDGTDELDFAVLPGFYRSFSYPPEGVETSPGEQFLFPGDTFAGEEAAPDLTLTEDGEALIQEEVDTLVDDCLEDADLNQLDCALRMEGLYGIRDEEDRAIEPEDFTWKVTQHPEVAAIAAESSILVSDRLRGTAELTVEGTYADGGGSTEVTHTCEIRTQALEAGFDPEGEVQLRPRGHRYEPLDDIPPDSYTSPLVDCR